MHLVTHPSNRIETFPSQSIVNSSPLHTHIHTEHSTAQHAPQAKEQGYERRESRGAEPPCLAVNYMVTSRTHTDLHET